MPDTGVDIARLGLEVDATQFVQATKAQEEFVRAGEKAEAQVQKTAAASKQSADQQSSAIARHLAKIRERDAALRQSLGLETAAEQQRARIAANREQEAAVAVQAAARVGHETALAEVEAAQRVLAAEAARIRIAQLQGFITPAQAAEAGREAATAYNAAVLATIQRGQAAGAFRGAAGEAALVNIGQSLVDVDRGARRSAAGIGRLSESMASLFRQAVGVHPAVGQLARVVGSLAIGSVVTVGVLAGLAAIGLAYRKLTEDARRAKEEAAAATKRLEELARRQALPAGGQTEADLNTQIQRAAAIRAQIARAQATATIRTREGAVVGTRDTAQLRQLRQELEDVNKLIRAARSELADIADQPSFEDFIRAQTEANLKARERAQESHKLVAELRIEADEQARLAEAAKQGAAASAVVTAQIARERAVRDALAKAVGADREEVERLVNAQYDSIAAGEAATRTEEARVRKEKEAQKTRDDALKQFRDTKIELNTQIREQERLLQAHQQGAEAVRELEVALAGEQAVLALGEDATKDQQERIRQLAEEHERASQRVKDFEDAEKAAAKAAEDAAKAAADAADKMEESLIRAAENIGRAFGGAFGKVASLGAAAASAGRVGGAAGLAGVGGVLAGGFTSFVSGFLDKEKQEREEERKRIEAANKALADFAESLRSVTSLQKTLETAEQRLRDVFRAAGWGDGNNPRINELFIDPIKQGVRNAGPLFNTNSLPTPSGPGSDAIREAIRNYAAALAEIEKQRRRDVASMHDEFEVRKLVAQGRDEDADALRRQIEQQKELADARALEDDELVAFLQSVHEFENAAAAAAKAAREAAQLQDFQTTFGVAVATGAGDDATVQRLLGEQSIRGTIEGFKDLVAAGVITQAQLDNLDRVLRDNLNKTIEETAKAAERAAEAERQRAEQFGLNVAARRAALEGDDIGALRLRLTAQNAAELAQAGELVDAGTITQQMFADLAGVLDDELAKALRDAEHAARQAAAAERFRRQVDMENLRIRLLTAQGLTREAQIARNQLEVLQAIQEGRNQEYIAMLKQAQALELAQRAQEQVTQAVEDTTRSLDGMTRVLNQPAGFALNQRRAQVLGVGSDPFESVRSPRFDLSSAPPQTVIRVGSVTIPVYAQPGQSPEDIAKAVKSALTNDARLGIPAVLPEG